MPSGESASLECNDWSDEVPNLSDALMVSLMSSEYVSFLQLEAYN